MRYCNECGAQIRDDSMFCSLCGAKVITVENTQVSSQPVDTPQGYVPPQQTGDMPQGYAPPQQAGDMPQGYVPPQQTGDMPQGYVPPQQTGDMPQGYVPSQQAGGMSQGQYPAYQLPPQNIPMQTDISTDKDSQKSSSKKKTAIIVSIASVFLIAIIAVIVVFVLSDKDDSSDGAYSSTDIAANSDDKKEDKREEESTTEVPTTEAVVIDTSYDGLLNNLSNLNSVNIRFVSSDVSDFPNVKAYFTVEDSAGNTVSLTSPNVAIKEVVSNGAEVEREIKSFEKLEGREGISIELVADKSGSMDSDIYTMQTIMSEFVNALDYNSGDKVELIAFDSYVMYMCTYTQDINLLNNGINNMTTYGETALYDALYEAVLNAGSQEGARCVIAFTDGMDNCSIHTAEEVINLANTYSIPIFIIGTYNGDYSLYSDITSRTGGIYWDIDSISDMSAILDSIYTKEKNMYCLEYASDASTDAYAQRSISCVVSDSTYGASIDTTFTATETLEKEKHESRYELIVEDISWSEANETCLRKGGHLITITSQEEMDQAIALAEGANLRFVWMGGYTSVRNNDAYGHWITGEPFEFTAWYPGEPSRTDKDGADEMYLMLWQVEGEWSWNDQRNDPAKDTGLSYFQGKVGYICEYED